MPPSVILQLVISSIRELHSGNVGRTEARHCDEHYNGGGKHCRSPFQHRDHSDALCGPAKASNGPLLLKPVAAAELTSSGRKGSFVVHYLSAGTAWRALHAECAATRLRRITICQTYGLGQNDLSARLRPRCITPASCAGCSAGLQR